ncbi:MAG TPA: hypothetical protein PLW95_02675 [bacterium]|nr:hypothetical protein [bacterium]
MVQKMKKVLIITYHFPPSKKVGVLRIKGLAKYLPEFGWEPVFVIPLLQQEPEINSQIIETHPPYQKFFKYYFSKAKKRIKKISLPLPPFHKRVKSFFRGMIDIPDNRIGWLPFAYEAGKNLIEKEKINHMISILGPATCHLVGSNLKKRYKNIFWIADFRDPWTLYKNNTLINKYKRNLEIETLKEADAITIVTRKLAYDMKKIHKNKDIYFIPNGFDPEEIDLQPQKLTENFTITHTGSLFINKRSPELLFKALSELIKEQKIKANDISIRFFGKNQNWVLPLAEKYGLKDVVKYYGERERKECLKKQRESQLLLIIQVEGKGEEGCLTGKIFEYLTSFRPILSIGDKDNEVSNLLKETDSGIHCTTVCELKETVLKYYREWEEKGYIGYSGIKEEIMKYSHREMAKKFADILNKNN